MHPQTMRFFGRLRQEELMREARAIHLAERFEATTLKTLFWWLRALWRPFSVRFPQAAPRGERS